MKDSTEKEGLSTRLAVSFPGSSEDHRLQLVEINGAIFAVLYAPLESKGPIQLHCDEWSLVLMAPIKSESSIEISATNIICLSEVLSKESSVKIHASNQLVTFADLLKAAENLTVKGKGGKYHFEDDPGSFLSYYRHFEGVVRNARTKNQEQLSEARQLFITALCTLAHKVKGKPEKLDLKEILDFWGIPMLKEPIKSNKKKGRKS